MKRGGEILLFVINPAILHVAESVSPSLPHSLVRPLARWILQLWQRRGKTGAFLRLSEGEGKTSGFGPASSLRDTRGIIRRLRRFFISFLIRVVKFTVSSSVATVRAGELNLRCPTLAINIASRVRDYIESRSARLQCNPPGSFEIIRFRCVRE